MREEPPNLPTTSTTKRLHISPLTPELLPIILPSPLLQERACVSYHTLQTFPERSYGYITLPNAEAEKITKKLNGSILRGSKMKVSEARPERKRRLEEEDGEEAKVTKKKPKKERKAKRDDGVLPGVEIQGRKVKRGWTEAEGDSKGKKSGKKDKGSKDGKKSKAKASSYTTEPELFFKTKIPPNATAVENGSSVKGAEKSKKKKSHGKSNGEAVVHEFAHTTKAPSFLRDNGPSKDANGTSEYVDGKGWVDAHGAILEVEPTNTKRTREKGRKSAKAVQAKASTPVPAIEVSRPTTSKGASGENEDETSSSGSSSADENETPSPPLVERLSITRSLPSPPLPSYNPAKPTTETPSPPLPNTTPTATPHPLETLFKRPPAPTSTPQPHSKEKGKPNLEVSTSFSFFNDNDPPTTGSNLAPQTPYTQMDIRQRRQRSAAPTPDTAMPGKSFWTERRSESGSLEEANQSLDDDDDDDDDEKVGKEKEEEEESESAFAKEFWEKRGERNRLAKRRVREAKKAVRQREN